MGLLRRIEEYLKRKEKEKMEKKKPELDNAEAAVALCSLISLADNEITEAEAQVLRKYYCFETIESLQKKIETAGYEYPRQVAAIEDLVIAILQGSTKNFKLRTMAVCLLVAQADGKVEQNEMNLLNRLGLELGITLFEAQEFADRGLREIDEVRSYDKVAPFNEVKPLVALTTAECGIALATLVAFSDDDPSDEEIGVVREYFSFEQAKTLQDKLSASGYRYPQDLDLATPSILRGLHECSRETQLKMMAIAYKVSMADGELRQAELDVIYQYCLEFVIGLTEVKQYFKTILV